MFLFYRYAALMVENWEVSAKAYRRYTYLQPNTFEAWNNLAKVYVNQGDKKRAYRALMEALRFNYDNWKVNVYLLITFIYLKNIRIIIPNTITTWYIITTWVVNITVN